MKNLFICIASIVLLSGCVTAKTYVVNKPRVDQEIPGMPVQEAVKTRKVIVVEMIEKDKSKTTPPVVMDPRPVVSKVKADEAVTIHDKDVEAPVSKIIDEEKDFTLPKSALPETKKEEILVTPQEYVVVKDDTLQKISKKVYGSYGKWTKIYDANRDLLKDPNFLKTGMKLKIPALEPGSVVK